MRRLLAGAGLAFAALVALASPAAAHASLESTEPAGGTALGQAPKRVLLRFSEPVEVSFGAIRVFDATATRVDAGRAAHPSGQARSVALALPDLDRGPYVVTWRVISGDSHPVHGAFTFRVGPPAADDDSQALARRLLASSGGSAAVGALYAVARLGIFASLVVLIGGIGFVVVVWPGGARDRRGRRLLGAAWALAVVSTTAGLALQGVYAGALPLADAFRPSVLSAVLDTRFGRMSAARLVLLVLLAVLWLGHRRSGAPAGPREPRMSRSLVLGAGLLGAGILLTPGLAGHAGVGDLVPVAVLADLAHLAAVSFWLGGLAVLASCVLTRGDPEELAKVVPRFSQLAFGAVVAIVVTGSFQAWRQVGSLDALTTTTFGRLLIVKLALFAGLVVLGAASRSWVRRRYRAPALALAHGPGAATAEPAATVVARLRRSVGAEVVVAVAVLSVTALLVNAVPARSALAKPYSTELEAKGLLINLTLDPAKAGTTDLHVYTLTPAGAVTDVEELRAELRLPARDIGPLTVPVRRAGPGHFAAYGFELPIAGQWKLDVVARLSDVDQVRASTLVPVR